MIATSSRAALLVVVLSDQVTLQWPFIVVGVSNTAPMEVMEHRQFTQIHGYKQINLKYVDFEEADPGSSEF